MNFSMNPFYMCMRGRGSQIWLIIRLEVSFQVTSIGIIERSSSMMLVSMSRMIPTYSRLEWIIY